jgi:hypothetical protein
MMKLGKSELMIFSILIFITILNQLGFFKICYRFLISVIILETLIENYNNIIKNIK